MLACKNWPPDNDTDLTTAAGGQTARYFRLIIMARVLTSDPFCTMRVSPPSLSLGIGPLPHVGMTPNFCDTPIR